MVDIKSQRYQREKTFIPPKKTTSRIMRQNNMRSKVVKKYKATKNSNHRLPIFPNLLNQQFKVNKPGEVWGADIT